MKTPASALRRSRDGREDTFRALHNGPGILKLTNVWDALSAKVFELAGAQAIGTSSAAVAWSQGYTDGERLPFSDLVRLAGAIVRVTTLPVSVDIEMGFANDRDGLVENIRRLLGEGIVGINVEDGSGTPDRLRDKLEAIRSTAARSGHKLFVNARCDVFYRRALAQKPDIEAEALRRASAYGQAGADCIFFPGLIDPARIDRLASAIALPMNLMMMEGLPADSELMRLGVRRVSVGAGLALVAYEAARTAAEDFLGADDRSALLASLHHSPSYQELLAT